MEAVIASKLHGNVLRKKLLFFSLIVCYIVLLNIAYVYYVVPEYAYLTLTYTRHDLFVQALINIAAFAPLIYLPTSLGRPSSLFIWIMYVVVFVPACFIPLYSLSETGIRISINLVFIFLGMFVLVIFNRLPLLSIRRINVSSRVVSSGLLLVFSILILLLVLKYGHLMRLVDIKNVYHQRKLFLTAVSSGDKHYLYPLQWLGGILCPFFVAYGIAYKKKIFWILGFVGIVFVYALAAYKSFLLQVFAIPVVILYLKCTRYSISAILIGILLFILLCLGVDYMRSNYYFTNLLVRRILIIPGFLTGKYWHFFSNHPYANFTNSLFKFFFAKKYPEGIPYAVGYSFLKAHVDADANIFASAYGSLGNVGVLVISFLTGVYLWLYDSLTRGFKATFMLALITVLSFRFTESSFTVSLFTGGAALMLLLLYFCNEALRHDV